MKLIDKIRGCK